MLCMYLCSYDSFYVRMYVCMYVGDHLKFTFPMAWSVTTLCWGLLEYWDAYESVGEGDHMLDTIKWPLDYLIKAHAAAEVLYYQVGR